MARRWWIPLTILPVVVGSLLAAGAAAASPGLAQHAARAGASHAVSLGHPMIVPVGATMPSLNGVLNTTVQSSNWSGYAVQGPRGTFRSVSANWIQPKAICKGVKGRRFAAFWAGLDGFNSTSVEQTGADSDCRGTTPVYFGWFEMFPAPPVLFRTRVNPGDHMSASVTFRGAGLYVLVLRDATRGWSHVISKREAGLKRSSAEVITERPSSSTGILPLADFGTIRYTGPRANGKLFRDLPAIRIVMLDSRNLRMDLTSLIGALGAFTNTWIRSF
jgi:hypothetical protein